MGRVRVEYRRGNSLVVRTPLPVPGFIVAGREACRRVKSGPRLTRGPQPVDRYRSPSVTDVPKLPEAVWRPIRDLPPEADTWGEPHYRSLVGRWREMCDRLTAEGAERWMLDTWLAERQRLFAIETGQIEDLYRLKRGVTEQLITEGFESARGAHSVTAIGDRTLMGLLTDQEAALEMVFTTVKDEQPLSHHAVKSWHQFLTRHQGGAPGRSIDGRRVEIPLLKGEYKIRPNNPRRPDGVVHEYRPPEQVRSEMDRFFAMHEAHRDRRLPTEVEAAWLHHTFVRTHPFQDGNGRASRLLMAYAFIRNGEFPPIITADNKMQYIDCLEEADRGSLRTFIDYLAVLASQSTLAAVQIGNRILAGRDRMNHANGGITVNGDYYPPLPDELESDVSGEEDQGA